MVVVVAMGVMVVVVVVVVVVATAMFFAGSQVSRSRIRLLFCCVFGLWLTVSGYLLQIFQFQIRCTVFFVTVMADMSCFPHEGRRGDVLAWSSLVFFPSMWSLCLFVCVLFISLLLSLLWLQPQ